MLVPTMTPEEIYAEMHKDADWLWNQIVKKFHPIFQKQVKRSNSFPCAKMFLATSRDTKITYHIVFVVHNRGGWDKIPTVIIYTQYSHEYGRNLIYIEPDAFKIRIYTPHFIQRYKERFANQFLDQIKGSDGKADLVFILQNWDIEDMDLLERLKQDGVDRKYYAEYEDINNQSRYWTGPEYERYSVACLSGVCLCERVKANPDISIFRTFISADILYEMQWYDFRYASAKIYLRALDRQYPRQRTTIAKEWDNFVHANLEGEAFDEAYKNLRMDFEKRYPLHGIL